MSSFLLDISLRHLTEIDYNTNYLLQYSTSSKFENDKVNYETDDFYLLLDGIVLNKAQLLSTKIQNDWAEYLLEAYRSLGDQFFKELKGSYYGFLFDKKANKWIVFTDHISSKPLYFVKYANNIAFSNSYFELLNFLKAKNVKISLSELGASLMLSYGYVFEDITITNEIQRLMVGHYFYLQNEKFKLETFFSLSNIPVEISEDDAIEQLDKRFRYAVKLAFDKDKEYGYNHIATLSGGLDSRMTVWVAHDLGYTDQLNLTFSQSNYLDETIPKQIAADLKHEWIFKALDNGTFLYNIDEVTKVSGGNVLYYGIAHGMSLYKYINYDNLGIMHSGQLGDVVVSTFFSSLDRHKQFNFGDGAYSNRMLSSLKTYDFKGNYPNEEIFKMYIRGFYGANQGLCGIMQHTETYSPFYDIDFMEFALSIPLQLRFNHYLYKRWIIKKYPKASKYIWERDKVPVDYPYWLNFRGRRFSLNQLSLKIAAGFGYKRYGSNTINNMNPLDYWYNTNPEMKCFLDKYFKERIQSLNEFPKIKSDCEKLYVFGMGSEKIQALSLLSATSIL